jgi:hypothetical protein
MTLMQQIAHRVHARLRDRLAIQREDRARCFCVDATNARAGDHNLFELAGCSRSGVLRKNLRCGEHRSSGSSARRHQREIDRPHQLWVCGHCVISSLHDAYRMVVLAPTTRLSRVRRVRALRRLAIGCCRIATSRTEWKSLQTSAFSYMT